MMTHRLPLPLSALLTLGALLGACGDKDSAADDTAPVSGEDTAAADADGDGFDAVAFGGEDCDDADAGVYPGADEYCDEVDNDCDGDVDEDAVDATRYVDADGDGYGQDNAVIESCDLSGTATQGGDCDDVDAAINPDAEEVCDGDDNDCDGLVDAEDDSLAALNTWYPDADRDGYGDPSAPISECDAPDGYTDDTSDCDDADADAYPGAAELESTTACMRDADEDGYGDADATGDVVPGVDCDDASEEANPDGEEVCDGLDNDCDGAIDDDAADAELLYTDSDGDGYGVAGAQTLACAGAGYSSDDTDCDDRDSAIYPGAPEADCADPVDYNCDGSAGYDDLDGDGYAACEECDDSEAASNPDAVEICDGVDNDCDSATNEAGTLSMDGATYGSISGALAAASVGSEILLCEGSWTGSWDVKTSVSVVGVGGADAVTVDAAGAGAVFNVLNYADFSLEGLTITGGIGDYDGTVVAANLGGGVNGYQSGSLSVTDCVFTGNSADYGGGLLGSLYGTTITGSTFENNTSTVSGAGLYLFDATINDTVVQGNDSDLYAGGIMTDSYTVDLIDVTVQSNTCTEQGGGLILYNSTVTMTRGAVLDNTSLGGVSYGGYGGGVHLDYLGDFIADGTDISGNEALYGGGLFLRGGSVLLSDVTLEENTASYGGGAWLEYDLLYAGGDADLTSEASHWGSTKLDNSPDDVDISGIIQYATYGASETFSCNTLVDLCY